MFTQIDEATNWLMSLRGKKELEIFRTIMDRHHLDYPSLKVIHVTGTNGKGSTANYIRCLLNQAGYKVGLFTSPYIECHQDRFSIDGKRIDDQQCLALINHWQPVIEQEALSMFESDVLLALAYFIDEKVDYAIMEVGIGGRYDKTNIVTPVASVITNIGHDHLSVLGPTLKDVAYDKAGIIKAGAPAFTTVNAPELLEVIENCASEVGSRLTKVIPASSLHDFSYGGYVHLDLGNVASYQINNACLAIEVAKHLVDLSQAQVESGLAMFSWPARFEAFSLYDRDVYLDGAHNSDAMEALFASINQVKGERKVNVIYAALRDKEYDLMAKMIKHQGYELNVCSFEDDRALSREEALAVHADGFFENIAEAIKSIEHMEGLVVVCGSLHFVSQVRDYILGR